MNNKITKVLNIELLRVSGLPLTYKNKNIKIFFKQNNSKIQSKNYIIDSTIIIINENMNMSFLNDKIPIYIEIYINDCIILNEQFFHTDIEGKERHIISVIIENKIVNFIFNTHVSSQEPVNIHSEAIELKKIKKSCFLNFLF